MTMHRADPADSPKGEICHRLDEPSAVIDLPGLAEAWIEQRATWRLAGLAALGADPGLCGRIRGAFGHRLMAGASPATLVGEPCPWSPPCAFEVLWRKQGRLRAGLDHASPWVIATDPRNGHLDVSLSLFGFAVDWMPAAIEAMTAALRQDVDWRGQTSFFIPRIEILGRHVRASEGPVLPEEAVRGAQLTLLSPLALSGVDPRERPGALLMGLLARVEALARWHDATLADTIDHKALGMLSRELAYDWRDIVPVRWARGSKRQDRQLTMRGLLGELEITAQEPFGSDVLSLLALGERCRFGADVAFGCGRYALSFL